MNNLVVDPVKCKEFVQNVFMKNALPSLMNYIKIKNISKGYYTQQEWADYGWNDLMSAAQHIEKWVKEESGIKGAIVQIHSDKAANLTPLIFIEIEGQLPETILLYGHFDKQPPFLPWGEGLDPYIPVLSPQINPEKLYGRGGADDGYSVYGSILAIRALQEQGIPHPRCVLLIEGDQETGSGDVQKHVVNLKERIGDPKLIFCLDSGTRDYERFWATTSLRGYCFATIRVDVLTEGVHSGSSSGIIPNSFRILRKLLTRIEDQDTGYMSKQLDVNIPANRYTQMSNLSELLGEQAVQQFPKVEGLLEVSSNPLQSLILGGWKAQMVITGINGYPQVAKAGNVMLPYTEAKISVRLPPTANHQECKNYIVKTLTENPPYNAKVVVTNSVSDSGFNNAEFSPNLKAAITEVSNTYFGNNELTICQGGSIPFMGFLRTNFPNAEFIVTGVLGPGSNAHGPNQFLHIPYVKKLICSIAELINKTSSNQSKQGKQGEKEKDCSHGKHGKHGNHHGHHGHHGHH